MRWFSDQSLGRQLQAAFALVLLVLQAASCFTLWTTLTNEQADTRVTHIYELLDLTQGALNAVGGVQVSYQSFLLTGDPALLERYTAGQRAFQDNLDQLQLKTASPTLRLQWQALKTQGAALQRDMLDPAIATRQAADNGTAAVDPATPLASITAARPGFEALRVGFDQPLEIARTALSSGIRQSAEAGQRMLAVLIGGMLLATALAAAIALILARSIAEAISKLASAAQRIAQGDLGSRVELERHDEIGQAAIAFNRMVDHLQTTIDQTESILTSTGEGIMGSDPHHGFTFVNPAAEAMLGYAPRELFGKPVHATVHHSRADGTPYPNESCPVHFTLADGVTRHVIDEVMWRKDGTCFPVEYTCGRLRGGERGHGAVVTFRDITERKRTEAAQRHSASELVQQRAELQRSNQELQDFASVASHDLQEPLRKVQAFGDRLHKKCAEQLGEEGRLYVDRMQDAASRMQTLITDLLVFSRVTTQARPFVELDLNLLVGEVIADLEITVERSGAKVEVGVLPTIVADPLQMRQLFQNLLSNGLKFRQPGVCPQLRVASRCITGNRVGPTDTDWYEISVSDNGIGFDEKYLDRIFTIFQRLHGRDEYEGTGLGLAVCRKIADRHGGAITARSTLQHGSTFLLSLPSRQAVSGATHAG